MRIRFVRLFALAMVAMLLGSVREATAGLVLKISATYQNPNGVSQTATAQGTTANYNSSSTGSHTQYNQGLGSYGNTSAFTIVSSASSNLAGGNLANLEASITNNTAYTATITFDASSDGFTGVGSNGSEVYFYSTLVAAPTQGTTAATVTQLTSMLTQGALAQNTPTQTRTTAGTDISKVKFTRSSNTYNLANRIVLTIAAGATVSARGETKLGGASATGNLVALTSPEPGAMAMVAAGLPVAGLFYARRKRAAKSAA